MVSSSSILSASELSSQATPAKTRTELTRNVARSFRNFFSLCGHDASSFGVGLPIPLCGAWQPRHVDAPAVSTRTGRAPRGEGHGAQGGSVRDPHPWPQRFWFAGQPVRGGRTGRFRAASCGTRSWCTKSSKDGLDEGCVCKTFARRHTCAPLVLPARTRAQADGPARDGRIRRRTRPTIRSRMPSSATTSGSYRTAVVATHRGLHRCSGREDDYPARCGKQLRTFIDDFLAGLDRRDRPATLQPVPAMLRPARSASAKAQFGRGHERYDPGSGAEDETSHLDVG